MQPSTDFTQDRVYLPEGTLSVVHIDDLVIFAVERSKTDPLHPCLPEARYSLEKHFGPKSANGPIWAFVNHDVNVYHEPPAGAVQLADGTWTLADGTPIRVACLFGHVGNDPKDVEGCDAFGLEVPDWTKPWVSESHAAVFAFQEKMNKAWTSQRGILVRAWSGEGNPT